MKLSAFRLISLAFSLASDSTLAERFRLLTAASASSGVGERFVDETGGDDDDWTSESFSLSFELLFVSSVIERLMKLSPVADDEAASVVRELLAAPSPVALVPSVCRNHGKSL